MSDPLVTEFDKAQAVRDVRDLILLSGQQALVTRETTGTGRERLYGSDAEPFVPVGTIPIEFHEDPPEKVDQDIDATASVFMDADVQEGDRLDVRGKVYRVQSADDADWFGIVTHKSLKLVRLHGVVPYGNV